MTTILTQQELYESLGLTPDRLFWLRFDEAERFVNRCGRWTPKGKARILGWKMFWNWYLSRWNGTDEALMRQINLTGVPMYIDDYTLLHRSAFGEQLPPVFWKELIKETA